MPCKYVANPVSFAPGRKGVPELHDKNEFLAPHDEKEFLHSTICTSFLRSMMKTSSLYSTPKSN
jgi:hypothetical protein